MARFTTLSAVDFNPSLKFTIQNTGRIGVGEETTRALGLNEETYLKFVIDQDEEEGKGLYIAVLRSESREAFKAKKVGKYYNFMTQRLFDSLGIDYRTQTVMLDLVRCGQYDAELGGEVYRLNIRSKVRKENSSDDELDEMEL